MENHTPVHLGQVRSALEEVGVPEEQIETALQLLVKQ